MLRGSLNLSDCDKDGKMYTALRYTSTLEMELAGLDG